MGKWIDCTIADIGTVVGGATPSTKKMENYENGTIPWITPKDLSGFEGRYISKGERNITEAGLKSCSTQLVPPHTVLFTSRAPIGYVAIAENEVCTNQGFKSVIPNKNTDYMFLYYLLKYNKDRIENMGSGTTFKEVSGNTMKGIAVKVPEDIKEQRAIACILSSIDDKIELNNNINKNLEQQAFSLFCNLVTVSNGVQKVADIADLNPTRSIKKNEYAGCIDMAKLSTTSSIPSCWEYKQFTGGMKFTNGDTIMARITPCLENGKTAFINFLENDEIAFGSTEYIVLSPKKKVPAELLYCLVKYEPFVQFAVKHMNGSSGRQRVTADSIGSFELPLFSQEAMDNFAFLVHPYFEHIKYNALENMDLLSLRDALLPKLMSGEIDVSNINL